MGWKIPLKYNNSIIAEQPKQEEKGIKTTKVADSSSYFLSDTAINRNNWFVNIIYEMELENLNFSPSDECMNVKFVDKEDIQDMKVFPSIVTLGEMFKLENHSK